MNTWLRRGVKGLLLLTFVNVVFVFFDWSRAAAIGVIERAASAIERLVVEPVNDLPDLLVVIDVILVARFALHVTRLVFEGVRAQRIHIPGFYPEWARTSFNFMRILVVALTAVIVFAYLPGSSSCRLTTGRRDGSDSAIPRST